MLRNEDIRAVVVENELPPNVAMEYLNIYVGNSGWEENLKKLVAFTRGKNLEKIRRQIICCGILLPSIERNTNVEPYDTYLRRLCGWAQVKDKDWFAMFQEVVKQDVAITDRRIMALGLGVIDPIEYAPNTRQAYNWLYMKAEEAGAITSESKEDVKLRFQNLVKAYGGAVICNIFTRHEGELRKVLNWRSGYFFERVLWDVYTLDQVKKIKQKELDTTSERLVKRIKVGA